MKLIEKKKIVWIVLLSLVFGCVPKSIVSYEATKAKPKKYTKLINYYLPKSILKIKVPVEKSKHIKGLVDSLSTGAKDTVLKQLKLYFGWKELKPAAKFSLGKKIQFIPITVPDTNKHYTIAYRNAKVLGQTLNLKLNKDGLLSSGEFSQRDKTVEVIAKTLELGANTAGAFLGLNTKGIEEINFSELASNGGSKIALQRINFLIEELKNLNEAKQTLMLENASSVSKKALAFRMNLINKRVSSIKNEILGYNKKTTNWLSLMYEPKEANEEFTLITLDTKLGVKVPNGENAALAFINESGEKGEKSELKLIVTQIPFSNKKGTAISQNKIGSKKKAEPFLHYNIPAKYSIQLFLDNKPLKSYKTSADKNGIDIYSMYFPQMGQVGVLPNEFKTFDVVFYEDIGALKEINFSREAALNKEAIESIYAAADSVASLRRKLKEAKEAEESVDETSEETEETVIRILLEKMKHQVKTVMAIKEYIR